MQTPQHWHSDSGLARVLAPAGWLYGKVAQMRQSWIAPRPVSRPVVCVGNLVSGGAGKTPVALALQAWWAARGRSVHFLTRGYGGRLRGPVRVDPAIHDMAAVGDEPLLLAARAPTWVSRDRVSGAVAAIAAGADLIVMDDGHQNPGLRKDLSLIVVDAPYGFGNGRVLPAGPLREPLSHGLARADAVIVVGDGPMTFRADLPEGVPVLRADLVAGPGSAELAGRRVFAFAGIGRPEKFSRTLSDVGCEVVGTRSFADHHPYRRAELDRLIAASAAMDATPVTTEKDAVRMDQAYAGRVAVLPVAIRWRDEAALADLLQRVGASG